MNPPASGAHPVHILKRKMEKVPTKHERLVKFIMMSSAHWAPMYASLCINHQTHRFCFSANVGIFTTTRLTLPLFHCFEYTFALFASHVQCPIVQLISGSCTLQPSDITARVLPLHPQYFKVSFSIFLHLSKSPWIQSETWMDIVIFWSLRWIWFYPA